MAGNQSLRTLDPVVLNEAFYMPVRDAYTFHSLLLGDLAAD
ncbi:MAG: hypothetical protein H6R25_1952 [Proteobacteria bacterium]|nr:hypothetical protein [Pseudomonadota bacterium]